MDDCINPNEIEDGDLLDWLDGLASEETAVHIENCAHCQAEAESIRAFTGLMDDSLARSTCPDSETLMFFNNQMLDANEVATVQTHLQTCTHCQAEMRQFTAVSPQTVDATSHSLWDTLVEKGQQILRAALLPQVASATAVRGQQKETLSYAVDKYAIKLVQQASNAIDDEWQLEGRILMPDDPIALIEGQVKLWQADAVLAEEQIDEFGYFQFSKLHKGSYTIEVQLNEKSIILESIDSL